MINNLALLNPFLIFPKEDSFYFIQILQRKKEHPELGNNSRLIKAYYIKSIEHLEELMPEMIKLAEVFNARVCINLNPRSFEKAAFQLLEKVSQQMLNKDFENVRGAYNSVCGNYHAEMDKRWLIDIDTKDERFCLDVAIFIIDLDNESYVATIPTKNGFHIITKPFRVDIFKTAYPDLNIHKNNPTLLYIP